MELPALTRDQVRQVDQIAIEQYGVPGIVLMENAGRGAAEIIDRVAGPGPVVVLCGGGNNAGDGYVIARHLELAGRDVRVVSLVDPASLSGDARTNAEIVQKSGIELRTASSVGEIQTLIATAQTLVDGMLGTGARGPLRGLFADAVQVANAADVLRIALDIPTGLDCDTGEAGEATFLADHTITFVARKRGFEMKDADKFVGAVHCVGIGGAEETT